MSLKRPLRDGRTELVFEPVEFLRRLATLIRPAPAVTFRPVRKLTIGTERPRSPPAKPIAVHLPTSAKPLCFAYAADLKVVRWDLPAEAQPEHAPDVEEKDA